MPYLRTPFLLSASQFDRFQLPYNEGGTAPYKGTQLAYALQFQQNVLEVMEGLPVLPAQRGAAVFSSACFWHCTSQDDSFWGVRRPSAR